MSYLLDTNVVLRFTERGDPQNALIRQAIRQLHRDGQTLFVTSQNLIEAWNVSTRPVNRNGYGKTALQVDRTIQLVNRVFGFLPDTPDVYPEWHRLVRWYSVAGVQVHDTRLVAVMRVYGVSHILTFNTGDFVRFAPEGISAVDPANV